jgi:hypothetical protein
MKTVSKDKTDYLAIGGNKSVIILTFKDNIFTTLGEFINIHSGPVVDLCFSQYYVYSASLKDQFIQAIGTEQYNDKSVSRIVKNHLEHLIPKIKSEYDSWISKTIPLPHNKFNNFELTENKTLLFLLDSRAPGITAVNLKNPSEVVSYMQDRCPSKVTSCGKNLLLTFDQERSICLMSSDMLELNIIRGTPIKALHKKDVQYSIKHCNSDDSLVWMQGPGHVVSVASDSLTTSELPPLALSEDQYIAGSAVSNNGSHIAMIVKTTNKEGDEQLIVIEDMESVFIVKRNTILQNCKF